MKITFRTFESGAGDCIFLVLNDDVSSSYHIMVDCNVLTTEIKKYIREVLEKRIDTLLITHIDSDHANGITKLFRDPEFADMKIGQILFNGFQPQGEILKQLPGKTKAKLEAAADLLPPTVDSYNQKTNGMDAASLIAELNKHPQWRVVWRKETILAGESIPLGNKGEWGNLRFLSPTPKALENLLHEVKLEYAGRLSEAPPIEEFEDQEKYYELMLRLSELRKKPKAARKTSAPAITKELLERYAQTDANESNVTCANKASLAFYWEGGEAQKRILIMGDAVSSQVVKELNIIEENDIWFEAIKVSHHGSKHNTSLGLTAKVDSSHYFFTGGKEGEGPHIETVAKIALKPLADDKDHRELHYNHERGIGLWAEMKKEEPLQLLDSYHIHLNTNTIHEFES